jgi:hypothetical protein
MIKEESYKDLEYHLRTAPINLKDYTLKSWSKQAKDVNSFIWSDPSFFLWGESKEGMDFWEAIVNNMWQTAMNLIPELK